MVFKGRFFSSKKSDTSSPDGGGGSSSSPRSLGSNSPIRLDKKKTKSLSASNSKDNSPITLSSSSLRFRDRDRDRDKDKEKEKEKEKEKDSIVSSKKDVKGKESFVKSASQNRDLGKPSLGFSTGLKSNKGFGTDLAVGKAKKDTGPAAPASAVSMSPIVASSLGLNKIKTRSGPLPQESFLGFGSGRDKGSALGASNLSKPLGGGGCGDGGLSSGSGKKNVGKKDGGEEKKRVIGNAESSGWVDNGSNSDGMSTESGPSRNQSPHVQARSRLQNAESSSEAGMIS